MNRIEAQPRRQSGGPKSCKVKGVMALQKPESLLHSSKQELVWCASSDSFCREGEKHTDSETLQRNEEDLDFGGWVETVRH